MRLRAGHEVGVGRGSAARVSGGAGDGIGVVQLRRRSAVPVAVPEALVPAPGGAVYKPRCGGGG